MSMQYWPDTEKPREKLLEKGPKYLSIAELLAILLRNGTQGQSALALARQLLNHFGDLKQLMTATEQECCSIKGLGPAKYVQLQAALELNRRYLMQNLQNQQQTLTNSADTKAYLLSQLGHLPQEVFGCLFLNQQHQVICFKELFTGSVNQAQIYPREVVKAALLNNATSVIISHNHPSGYLKPSQADIQITQQLNQALDLMDIDLLDHIIVTHQASYSLAEHGQL